MTMSKEEALNKLNHFAHNVLHDTIIGDLVIDSLEHFRMQANSDFTFARLRNHKLHYENLKGESEHLLKKVSELRSEENILQSKHKRIEKRLCNLRDQAEEMRDNLNNVIQSI